MGSDCLTQKPLSMNDFGTVHGTTQEVRVNVVKSPHNPNVPFPHRHDFYKLMAITKGRGWHEIDFNRTPIRPYQVFFIKPGQVHNWKMTRNASGYFVEFGRESIISGFSYPSWAVNQLSHHIDLSKAKPNNRDSVMKVFELMLQEYENEDQGFETSLKSYLISLVITLQRISTRKHNEPKEIDLTIDHFLILVEENFRKEHGIKFYAEKLKTSPKALTMKVSRGLGKSPRTVIHERCLLESRRLLAYSNFSISEVGFEVGLEDANYFSRFFKNATGLTPGAFRTKVKGYGRRPYSPSV
jgi:AraC family transcriptional regulator, transcriptional activator of pobA